MTRPLFLCHGGPTLVVEDNSYTDFLKELGKPDEIGVTPKAIVVFSAHWENPVTQISSVEGTYQMIYDFSGFPRALYEIQYPAKGDPQLAKRIQDLLHQKEIPAELDLKRGLDHATWDILYLMYPKAEIPVVQISINPFLPKEELFQIGAALRSLADDDILVIGSGSTVHNLGSVDWEAQRAEPWALVFDDWLIKAVEEYRLDDMINYRELAPNARHAVPREEHLVPLFIALGMNQDGHPKTLHRSYVYGTLSYIAFAF